MFSFVLQCVFIVSSTVFGRYCSVLSPTVGSIPGQLERYCNFVGSSLKVGMIALGCPRTCIPPGGIPKVGIIAQGVSKSW